MEPRTLQEAVLYYSDLEVCKNLLPEVRWGDSPVCERCGSLHVKKLSTRKVWKCYDCKRQFSVIVGTIFEDTKLGLDKWFVCMWMIANCKNGVSSYEIHRALGIKQETAWFMLHRVRHAMKVGSIEKFKGTVEVDETYIGGKPRKGTLTNPNRRGTPNKRGAGTTKTIAMGILQREGNVTAKVVLNAKRRSLVPEIREVVEPGSKVFSDSLMSYRVLSSEYDHKFVDHSKNEFVRGDVTTNTIESYWSLLKRSLKGTYISVEPFHLNRYLDEQSFRYNYRKTDDSTRFRTVLGMVAGKRLTYDELKTFG